MSMHQSSESHQEYVFVLHSVPLAYSCESMQKLPSQLRKPIPKIQLGTMKVSVLHD